MAKLVVIGGGTMGLAAAYHGLKAGHEVELIEAAPELGGMAAHFDLDGLSIERFYHFICKADAPTFALLDELGIGDRLRWRTTSMGLFTGGRLHDWGNPLALLRFGEIGLIDRLRYGLLAFVSTHRERWDALEQQSAREWITRWCGKRVYERLWKPLFDLKFYEYADDISAAWIWTRVKRIGRSRRSLMAEELGYLEGGSQTLVDALARSIRARGGRIRTACPSTRVRTEHGRVTGVDTPQGFIAADAVISTVPTPLIPALVPDLPAADRAKYEGIANIGVCCLVFKLRRPVTPHFWVNISEPGVLIPGIIEFSNLRPTGDGAIVYVPYYMPTSHAKFGWPDEALIAEAFAALKRINPALTRDDVIAAHVARLRHAQPVCEPGFAAKLPPVETAIHGLQIADTCFYYPEDRGIAESVRLAEQMVRAIRRPSPPLVEPTSPAPVTIEEAECLI